MNGGEGQKHSVRTSFPLIFSFTIKESIHAFSGGKKPHGLSRVVGLAFDFARSREINLEINNKIPLTKSVKGAVSVKAVKSVERTV